MKRLIYLAIALVTISGSLLAQYVPSWWLDNSNPVLIPYAPTQSKALANAGQLKWMATRAKAHFDATLPGGAGTTINNLIAGFNLTGNYVPINLGQLKAVALPFYDRLWNLSPRYDTNLNLKANGYTQTWTSQYPWSVTTGNYKLVTLGQLKLVFSFDIVDSNQNGTLDYLEGIYPAASNTRDTDGDGVPDVEDALPNDPAVTVLLVVDPNDHTSPTLTLTKPTGAVLTP